MNTQERRSMVRREADRDLVARFQALSVEPERQDDAKELRHKRRRAIRHTCQVHIAMKLAHSSGRGDEWTTDAFKVKGRILDLSGDGCAIFTAQQLDIGQELNLIVELQNGKRIQVSGAIRWTKRVAERNGFASGVQFARMQSADQRAVMAFLEELDRTIGL